MQTYNKPNYMVSTHTNSSYHALFISKEVYEALEHGKTLKGERMGSVGGEPVPTGETVLIPFHAIKEYTVALMKTPETKADAYCE